MTWVKLDDGFFRHAKARAAGLHGRALYLVGLCWCKANLRDGTIPKAVLPVLAAEAEVPGRRTASALVAAGLWHDQGEHWAVHDWEDYHEPAAVQRERRQKEADRQRRWRSGRLPVTDPVTRDETRDNARSNGVASPSRHGQDTDIEVVPSNSLSKGTVVAAEEWRERDLADEPTRLRVNGWNL